MKLLVDKRGFVYFVEIALSILILMFIFDGFLETNQQVFANKQVENLRWQAWGSLDVLQELGVLNGNIANGDFGKVDTYIRGSLLNTQAYRWEYLNYSQCYSVDSGLLGTSSDECTFINTSTRNNIVSAVYLVPNLNISTSSIRLFLWSRL